MSPSKTGYAKVNGLNLYYEIHGAGDSLILLHGGLGSMGMFGPVLSKLAEHRQVIAVDLQAHGRTADVDRPLSFDSMADDIGALAKDLGIQKADIAGDSLGGGVALRTAIRHPNVVKRLVVISTPFKRDGWYPEILAGQAQLGPQEASPPGGVDHVLCMEVAFPSVSGRGPDANRPPVLEQDALDPDAL